MFEDASFQARRLLEALVYHVKDLVLIFSASSWTQRLLEGALIGDHWHLLEEIRYIS